MLEYPELGNMLFNFGRYIESLPDNCISPEKIPILAKWFFEESGWYTLPLDKEDKQDLKSFIAIVKNLL